MKKLTLIILLTLCSQVVYSQHDFFILKKKNKTIATFWQGSYIAFQGKSHEWFTGYITKVQNDSFYIRPMVVRYSWMGSDTVHYSVLPFVLADVFAMPKKGVILHYVNDRFQISGSGGHVHWYWIKSGWIFRAGGAGYILLNVVNGLAKNTFSISDDKLKIAAGIFLFGELLRRTYKLTLPLGKKYHLKFVKFSQ